jgi:hypothetical protein
MTSFHAEAMAAALACVAAAALLVRFKARAAALVAHRVRSRDGQSLHNSRRGT